MHGAGAGPEPRARDLPVYVALTTLPSRIDRLQSTIESLLSQTRVPDRIFICLPERSVREQRAYALPPWLTGSPPPSLKVVRSPRDFGPGTKLLGCLSEITCPACLIVVDDDNCYKPFVVERLYRAQRERKDASFSFYVYDCGPFRIGQGADGFSFYTPNLDGIELFARRALRNRFAFVSDDVWISLYLRNKGIRIESLAHTLRPGEMAYEPVHSVNQVRHLDGELGRSKATGRTARALVNSGCLRLNLCCLYWTSAGCSFLRHRIQRLIPRFDGMCKKPVSVTTELLRRRSCRDDARVKTSSSH